MNALSNQREDTKFIKIIADSGKFHKEVPKEEVIEAEKDTVIEQENRKLVKSHDGKYFDVPSVAVIRTGEVNGESYFKVEYTFDTLVGKIKTIDIKDSEYGTNLYIKIEDVILGLNVDGSFAQDLMKKIPNINLEENIILQPYSFTNNKGKDVRGVSVKQGTTKVENFFVDKEKKIELHGYPEFPKDYKDWPESDKKDNWKIYRINVTKFLKSYILDNCKFFANVEDAAADKQSAEAQETFDNIDKKDDDLTANDIPGWESDDKKDEAPSTFAPASSTPVANTPATTASAPVVETTEKA